MSAWWLFAALVVGSVEDEQAELNEKIEAERALFEGLKSDKTDLLAGLDWLERAFRASNQRAEALKKSAVGLQARAERLGLEAQKAQQASNEKELALAPRLRTLYRLERDDRLSRLVSAKDFGAMIKRERGLSTLVQRDLGELEALAKISRYQHLTASRIERLLETAQTLEVAVKLEQQLATARKAKFLELLATTNAEEKRVSRVIAELEREEKQLANFVGEMRSSATSGFRSRKGHLPLPVVAGLVEVGFGKVVNPRFNTITVQKGLDIRGAMGAKVLSVGQGTVAFAGWLKGYGNLVIVDHGAGYHSLYAHLARSLVEAGNEVEEGEEIAAVGDTGSLKGAFLYFEIRKQGQAIDPAPWLESD
jgi:septal ring factor EnvC (AmiA/AmiB activator)